MSVRSIPFLLLLFFSTLAFSQSKHNFSFGKDEFLLDGKPFQIISGEIHPARIPKEYWLHRIQMVKAMGCNTIAAYIFWNHHEEKQGQFDFKTENRDLQEFLRLCKKENMWVLLRPGPYVCAEWDFGGLPSYLLKIPDIKVRCLDHRYMNAVAIYINRLAREVKPFLSSNGGPILMVQIENEYGSYGNDKEYLDQLKRLWQQNGIPGPFFTGDGATAFMLEAGNVEGAAIGLDSGSNENDFEQAKKKNPNVPAFSSETYPGWLTHWGEKWARPDTKDLKKELEYLLKNKKSFNLYVAHGGTNFGFTAGANAGSPTQYQPDLTSYDYDAPINEQGQPTAKFFMIRRLISEYTGITPMELPAAIKTIEIPAISMQRVSGLWDNLPAPILSPQPKPMEFLDQKEGLILYKTKLIGHKSGKLTITEPHDHAWVFLNGKYIGEILRDGGKWSLDIPKSDVKDPKLEILVEAMGRINYGQYMIDRKGITDRVTLNGMTLMDWQIYKLPLDAKYINGLNSTLNSKPSTRNFGNFFKGEFNLTETGDVYFDLSNYAKGIVYVNGHNLGRYWSIGPQQRLYCPASWLKKGSNEIIVFDFTLTEPKIILGRRTLE